MIKKDLLIIGKIPPPIGGVTIHVSRLLDHLEISDINYKVYNLSDFKINTFLKSIRSSSISHIHTSNPFFRLICVSLLVIIGKQSIVTIHGNLGRFGFFKNLIDKIALKLCSVPILLNKDSFQTSMKINQKSRQISAFLPPIQEVNLEEEISKRVHDFIGGKKNIYCTNAFDLTFDKDGIEIYGITELVKVFLELNDFYLIFSDPSGNYSKHLIDNKIRVSSNILIISKPHSFVEIIKKADGLIRSTTTDGDSLSVKEGIFFGKRVICSDCVQRSPSCELYKTGDWKDFTRVLKTPKAKTLSEVENGYVELEKLYKSLLR